MRKKILPLRYRKAKKKHHGTDTRFGPRFRSVCSISVFGALRGGKAAATGPLEGEQVKGGGVREGGEEK